MALEVLHCELWKPLSALNERRRIFDQAPRRCVFCFHRGRRHMSTPNIFESLLKMESANIGESYTLRVPAGLYKDTTLYEPVLTRVRQTFDTFQAQPDDIVLVSYYKCGSTWIKSLAYSLLNYRDECDPLVGAPIMQVAVPTIEETRIESAAGPAFDGLASLAKQQQQVRLYHTHLPYRALPPDVIEKRCRIVYVARNPKDMLVSMASFMKVCAHREVYWAVPSDADAPLGAIAERNAQDLIRGGEMYGPFMRHAPETWDVAQDKQHILFLHYEQLVSDYEAQVRRLAAFLRCQLDEGQITRVCERTVFGALKATESAKSRVNAMGIDPKVYFDKGTTDRWSGVLSKETVERVDRFCLEALGESEFRFAA